MKKWLFKIIMVIVIAIGNSYSQNNHPIALFSLNMSGIDALKKGNFKLALDQALKDSVGQDTAFRFFKLGAINSQLNNHSKALFYFRLTAQKSLLLEPFAYEFIGDIKAGLNDWQNALNAYRVVMNSTIPSKYKNTILSKIQKIYQNQSSSLPVGTWLDEYKQWLEPQLKSVDESLLGKIDSVIATKQWDILDSVVLLALKKDPKRKAIINSIYNANIPDTVLNTKTVFSIAQSAYNCKAYENAFNFLEKAKNRADFSNSIPERNAAYFEIKLFYASENYQKTISLIKKYEKKYTPESELLMLISRSYRKIDNEQEALKWYGKHIKLYPNHPKTAEILWLMAWRLELLDKYKGAASYYLKIQKSFKNGSRIEESILRQALCYFKLDNYDSSIILLNTLINKYPLSTQLPAAKFWKAKSFLALDKLDSANVQLKEVAQIDPYDYYANRSRQILQLLGDTTEYSIDTSTNILATLYFLDSISPPKVKKPLSSEDSISLYRGISLLTIGKAEESDFFLENIELSYPGNLELQFRLALVYQYQNASKQAFRVARRLTWRIPQDYRNNLPFPVYKLFFPSFYAETIKKEAALRNIDPFLVISVIRQESIFNPTIVSPAGAVGLMQIMPFTGKDVARRLGESFTVDSLYLPHTNIRYGTSYLRQLMDEFDDNIVLVLAGYNGGPINAKRWFDHNKNDDFDLFVEDIEFSETRTYVKKVLSNYWTYRMLSQYPQYVFGSQPQFNTVLKGD